MNNIFITINMAIFTTISFSQNLKSAIIIIAGIMVCILWIFLINSYKLLNEEKYKVIIELESYLPKEPFHDEWERLKNNSKYNITTKIERFLAMGFIIVYVVLGILVFKNK